MSVLIDTPVWSEFFRRTVPNADIRDAVRRIVADGEAILVGPIRQEILSGVKDPKQFLKLRDALRAFDDATTTSADHENAAAMFNHCRSKGVQGSNTDFLLCALSARLAAPIFTLDRDFEAFSRVLSVRLYDVAG
jgi:predicted nucleic acid-binding protein